MSELARVSRKTHVKIHGISTGAKQAVSDKQKPFSQPETASVSLWPNVQNPNVLSAKRWQQ